MLEYDRPALGRLLRSARRAVDLTQTAVAKRLGYTSPQFLSNIERGTCVAPLETLSQMLRIYEINPNEIIELILDSQTKLLTKKLRGRKT